MASITVNQLQLAPLGAGDLIDRTVRLYRRHFITLIRASAPPVLVSSAGAVLWSIGVRAVGSTDSEQRLVAYFLMAALGFALWCVGFVSQLIVMGGASRSLVLHLLRGEPVTARAVYRNVRSRFWALLFATLAMCLCGAVAAAAAFLAWFVVMLLLVALAVLAVLTTGSWLTVLLSVVIYLAGFMLAVYVFFLVAGRVAYVPQVLMVEGRGVFASVGRSSALSHGNVRRLVALFLFILFATYSASMLLLIPLGWVGYLNGVNPLEFDASRWPLWYSVGYQVIAQLSTILLAPVWMLGLSLLYVDERVRREGYDVELLAAQRFGEMPALPAGTEAPLAPAVAGS